MATSCSHILLKVNDLHQAVNDYRQLGFKVDYATTTAKAQHAHIWFTHGPVIELLTTPRSARYFRWPIDLIAGRGAGRRMTGWAHSREGICDVAVVTDTANLKAELATYKQAGIPFGRALRWKRTRPDGQQTRFQFAYPRNNRLPFLVTPYDPPQHPEECCHPNGARKLSRVRMGVRDEDLASVRRIINDDPTFVIEPAQETRVYCIEVDGLTTDLDPAFLHGAIVRPFV